MTTLFLGENTAERDKAYQAYVAKFVSNNGDMAIDYINVEDASFGDIIDAVTTMPFLSNKRMVVIKYLSGKKDLADKLEDILGRKSDTTELVIVETTLDNRSIYAKNIKKLADIVNKYDSLDGANLIDWLIAEVKSADGAINRATAQYLVERVGHNQQLLSSDIKKMLLIDGTITNQIIDEMTEQSPHSSVFNMLDSLMQGRADVASRLYDDQRAQGMEPLAILGMVTWQLFALAAIVASKGDPPDVIAKRLKLSPFVVRKNLGLASRLNRGQMVSLLDSAIEADESIKTGKSKADNAVHNLLLELGSKVQIMNH